jgi:hypothetical protein
VNVYVESNFVLELVFVQKQEASCEEIVRLSESGSVTLVIPAYSLVEPFETLGRRHQARNALRRELDRELGHLKRTAYYTQNYPGSRVSRLCSRTAPIKTSSVLLRCGRDCLPLVRSFRWMRRYSKPRLGMRGATALDDKMPSFMRPCFPIWRGPLYR